MAFIVEMAGGPDGRHYSCSGLVWQQLLQLARENGWEPLGTSADPVWKHLWDEHGKFSPTYDCDEYGKVISATDAAALADALERASEQPLATLPSGPKLFREGMTISDYRRANAELDANFLAEFVIFLRKGEFSFFWDD